MQTTLLGLAIAFILALIAALIGPYFIDWNKFRPQFEAEASRVVGAPVRVGGKLDALLLPTPTLRLRSVVVGREGDPAKMRAGKLDVEFSLGALMRGEWRAGELSVDDFDLDVGLDRHGRLEWPAAAGGFNLGSLAIDRMNIAGRATLHDAASGRTLRVDDLMFSGDVRALAGSLRGEGSFTLLGARTPFRISSGPSGDGKGTRVRFVAGPSEPGLLADVDGVITFDNAVPNFEGGVTLARPDRKSSEQGQPWRITSRVKAGPSSAAFEQAEAMYGPDDKAFRLTGGGDLRFGASPLLRLALSARQLDADRLLSKEIPADGEPRRLIPVLQALVTVLPAMPLPAQIEASADQIAFGARALQNIALELHGGEQAWTIGKFDLRAPGATRVSASGTVAQLGAAASFTGPVSVESSDPDVLMSWLQGRSVVAYRNQKLLRVRGDATITADRAALDGIQADVNNVAIGGRLALLNRTGGKTRIEAALTAATVDLDTLPAVSALSGLQSAWPDEGDVSLKAENAVLAGQDLRPVAVSFSYDPTQFLLDRMEIGNASSDLAISASGSIDRAEGSGKLRLSGSAASLERLGNLISPIAPALTERLAAVPKEPGPAQLSVVATVGKASDRSGRANADVVLTIKSPQFNGTATLGISPDAELMRGFDSAALRGNAFNLETRLTAKQAATVVEMLGLDRMISPGDGPAQFESSVKGVWGSPLQLKARLTGAAVDGDVQGSGNPWADEPTAALSLTVRRADLAALFDLQAAGKPSPTVSLSSRLAVAGDTFAFEGLDATVGESRIRGRVVLTRGDEIGVNGEIGLDTLDLAAGTSLAFGALGRDASAPLGDGWLRGWRGRLSFQALSGRLPGGGELRPVSGEVRGDGQSLVLENVKAGIGGGEAAIHLDARQAAPGTNQGTSFNARVQLVGVDGAAIRYRRLALPESKVALDMTLAGQGRSAAGLTGALSGAGRLTLTDARVAGLNPNAFDVAIRASDGGQATDDLKLKDIVEPALAAGALRVPLAVVPFTIKDGRVRIEAATFDAARARVAIAGGYDLLADQADIRAVMSPVTTRAIQGRPEIRVDLNGSPDVLARTVDVAALSSWLGMRAIDRETRRLDQLERGVVQGRDEHDGLWEEDLPKADPIPSSEVRIPNRDPRRRNGDVKAASPRPAAAPPFQAPAGPPREGPLVQPLPPPIDIKPAPGVARVPKQRPAAPPAGSF